MPTTFNEIGASEKDIPILLKQLKINVGSSFGSFVKLTMEDAKNIYKMCLLTHI